MIQPKFKIGERVKIELTDQSGQFQSHPPKKRLVSGLTVTKVTLIESELRGKYGMKPYYRIVAENPNGYTSLVEGAERFFETDTLD